MVLFYLLKLKIISFQFPRYFLLSIFYHKQIRTAYHDKDVDRALVYSFLGFYITIPYWGSHLINVYEKMVWKGFEPQFVFTTKQQVSYLIYYLNE